ncbi:MAG: D-sedoheptulose 7-phosphate isomerase [Sphingomonadales bacterium]|nr:D-sedoheptulose 7-phosphate isomerase [Sphingomonadales bacterium]
MSIERIKQHFTEAAETLRFFMADEKNIQQIESAATIMAECLVNGGKIISCGNGGSHCDAMHFAEELSGRYRGNRKALAAMAISDPSHISCVGNDYGYEFIFSRYVEALGKPGDILLGISSSGNSNNIILAMEAARATGMKTVGLTGKDGGRMAPLCDVEIRAPHSEYADRAQEIHIKVVHALIDSIEQMVLK